MASASRVLYTGMTNDLERRVWQHKQRQVEGFTKRYKVTRLVYAEPFDDPMTAIRREKQIKSWTRARRIALIESINRGWSDLSDGWYK